MVMDVTSMDDEKPEFPKTADVDEWVDYMVEADCDSEFIAAGLIEFKRLLTKKPKAQT